MSERSPFNPFLEGILPFLDNYDVVFRICKSGAKTISLVITPIPLGENESMFEPICITGALEEIATILDDPQRGMKALTKQMANLELVPIERGPAEEKKPRQTRKRRNAGADAPDPAEAKGQDPEVPVGGSPEASVGEGKVFNDPKETEPDPFKAPLDETPEQRISIVPDEPPANITAARVDVPPEPKAPQPPKTSVFSKPAEAVSSTVAAVESVLTDSDKLDKYRRLSGDIDLEIRGMATDWNDVNAMWKELMDVWKNFDLRIQEDTKPRMRELHERVKKAQERDKQILNEISK